MEKVVIVQEELDGIAIDGTGNSEDLPRLVFIDMECGNLKVVMMVEDSLEIYTKRRRRTFYKPTDVH